MSEPGGLTRRGITGAAIAGGTAVAVLRPSAAAAATTYTPASYTKTRLAPVAERHLANRFAYGWTPQLGREIAKAGGPLAWFDKQLKLTGISDTFHQDSSTWWTSINLEPTELLQRHDSGVEPMWKANNNYQRWVLVRRMHSKRQVLETMTEFWENHFHVPVSGGVDEMFRIQYGKGIRARALGRFEDLLQFTTTSPAMGLYLNQAVSTASAPNEDLGRELLELHTVGRAAYTESDVVNCARLLTGWKVDVWKTWEVLYDPLAHWLGTIKILGFTDTNLLRDGRDVTRRFLKYLAKHPATAKRICRKLAVRFVSDTPSEALVEHLADVYLAHDTAIAPVLRALVASEEFKKSVGAKVRTPEDDLVATYRVLGARVFRPTSANGAANEILWQCQSIGLGPFRWPRPDGRPETAQPWASTSRMLASFKLHWNTSGGWYPSRDIRWRTDPSWLPQKRLRFDAFVDHMSRTVLGRRSTAKVLRACVEVTGCGPKEYIHRDHWVVKWHIHEVLATLLDSPAHMTR